VLVSHENETPTKSPSMQRVLPLSPAPLRCEQMNHMTKTYKKQHYPAGHGKAQMLPLGGFAHERAAFIMIHAKLHMLQKSFKIVAKYCKC